MTQQDRATTFHRLHQPGTGAILVLPNAWDAMTARLIEEAGARAIATTSAGVSWSLGRPDGHGLTLDEMIGAVSRLAGVVAIPVTADVEGGYGSGTPGEVKEMVRRVIGAPTIRRLAASVGAPLNIMAGPGAPSTAELGERNAVCGGQRPLRPRRLEFG